MAVQAETDGNGHVRVNERQDQLFGYVHQDIQREAYGSVTRRSRNGRAACGSRREDRRHGGAGIVRKLIDRFDSPGKHRIKTLCQIERGEGADGELDRLLDPFFRTNRGRERCDQADQDKTKSLVALSFDALDDPITESLPKPPQRRLPVVPTVERQRAGYLSCFLRKLFFDL